MKGRAALLLAAAIAAVGGAVLLRAPTSAPLPAGGPRLETEPGPPDDAGFARALRPRAFVLPLDHGPHYEYQTEWWYYTGNLTAADGRAFGFQLTFFRRGLSPGPPPPGPGLASNQVYFAHFALTDASAKRHVFFERWSRGAGELAGAAAEPFSVWLDDWRVAATEPDGAAVRLVAKDEGVSLRLDLRSRKPLARHGDLGLSAKSAQAGNASYYVGYTRMEAAGTVSVGGAEVAVTGSAWFDHEWSTSALGAQAVGWDWWSLQIGDGRELMYFRIRRQDGSIETVSGGTVVDAAGGTERLREGDVRIEELERWQSPQTGATYPVKWTLRAPSAGLDLVVDRSLDAQEMRTSFTYWEGAVTLSGTSRGRPVKGQGYVELTGYARSMQGVF